MLATSSIVPLNPSPLELRKRFSTERSRTRAYYAVFTSAVAFLSRVGFVVNNSSVAHTHVQHALNNSGVTEVVEAANRLRTLSAERRRADYHPADQQIGTQAVADQSLTLAEDAILALENVPTAALGAISSAILA